MSESEGFILKAEQFNQEEWCEMFIRVSETCKDLRVENECLQNQLHQKENIIKDIKSQLEYLETYSSKEDVFEDMKRRLDRIESIVNRK